MLLLFKVGRNQFGVLNLLTTSKFVRSKVDFFFSYERGFVLVCLVLFCFFSFRLLVLI